MRLTPVQERTLADVIGGARERRRFREGLDAELRASLERRLAGAAAAVPKGRQLWLTKARLVNLHTRCEGLYVAEEMGEGVFAYGFQLAVGKVVHKAVETGVYARTLTEAELAERALERLADRDEGFGAYVGLLDDVDRAELLGEAVRQLSWFRSTFPPLERSWNPVVEWPLRVGLAGGRVVLSARPDLVLGATHPDDPMLAGRVVIELKAGQERPEQDEDARFYALVLALHHGVPPSRVVTVNLQAGMCRPQEVTEDLLESAVRRVAAGAARAAALLGGTDPRLTPGKWCHWCPRAQTCPASSARATGG